MPGMQRDAGCSGSRRSCCSRRGGAPWGAHQGAPLKPPPKSISLGCIVAIIIFFIFLPLFSQPPGAVPGTQPLLPNSMDPTRQQGKPSGGGTNG